MCLFLFSTEIPYGDGPEPLYSETIGKNVYLNMIHSAMEYLYLTTPYLICDHELMNALKLAAGRGKAGAVVQASSGDAENIYAVTVMDNQVRFFSSSKRLAIALITVITKPMVKSVYKNRPIAQRME